MARSTRLDPVEVFRFDVQIISVSLSPGSLANNFKGGSITQFSRVGFSNVTTPEITNNVMKYRENTDNYSPRKIPGLQEFNDMTLSRGVISEPTQSGLVTNTKDFYRWVTKVNSANPALSLLTEVTTAERNQSPRQSENFRKDMIVILRDRDGKAARRWYILNAFPISYKGSTDLDAVAEQKAVESVTLAYEIAFELPSFVDAAKEFVADITESPIADIANDTDLDFGF